MKARNIIIAVIAVGLIAVAAFLLTKTPQVTEFDAEALLGEDAIANLYNDSNTLDVTKGSATIIRSDETTEDITERTEVGVGDTIKVSNDGAATLNWFDGSISRLQAGTELTIQKADYNPENIAETDINFNVIKGEVWSKVINLVDEDSEFLSYGGTVVAGVRGSAFNMVVAESGVEVESFEHAAFVAEIDETTKEILDDTETVVVSGQQVTVSESTDEIVPEDIPEEKLDRDWTKNNENRDEKAKERIKKRNLERIKRLAGPLPGEDGYKGKQKAIQKYLESIKDPEDLAKAKVRVAQIRANEAIAVAVAGGGSDVAKRIEEAKTQIAESNLPEAVKAKMAKKLNSEVKVFDRALDQVLPDNETLYEIKEVLREKRVELEANPEKKKRIKEKIAERSLYEIDDLMKKKDVKQEIIEKRLKKIDERFEGIKDRLENRPQLKQIEEKFRERIDAKLEEKVKKGLIDPEKAQRIKERVEKRIERKKEAIEAGPDKLDKKIEAIKERVESSDVKPRKIIKKIQEKDVDVPKKLKEAIKKEVIKEDIKESAEDRAKRIRERINRNRRLRKAQPKPTPEVIRDAPFHQGPSVQ